MTAQPTQTVVLDPETLSFADVVAVARYGAQVTLPPRVLERVDASRAAVDALAQAPEPVYGVSTGFGALAQRHIPASLRTQLQKSLIRSHAAGIGAPVPAEVVRAIMLLRLKTLVSGHTGVRAEVVNTYAQVLNAGIVPVVHEYGSLGCSGDLAPLSACALVLMGEGEVHADPSAHSAAAGSPGLANGTPHTVPAAQALAEAAIEPVILAEKEGLALINGTDGMLGMLILALHDINISLTTCDLSAAMSVEGLYGTDQVFAPHLHFPLRPQVGQASSAQNIFSLLAHSPIVASHKHSPHLVQDAYSLRCAPQVNGAARDIVNYAAVIAERELRASVDNPVVLADGTVSSNGNFHGAPLAYVLDFLAIALADVASMSERRTDRFMDVARNQGLEPFLADDAGVDSGLMIAHYTQAGLVSTMKRLATPASVDSIPSSAMQEDHVSMGWGAALKLRETLANFSRVVAIELYAAARGIDLRAEAPGPATGAALGVLRHTVAGPGADRFLSPELTQTVNLVASGELIAAAAAHAPVDYVLTNFGSDGGTAQAVAQAAAPAHTGQH